MPEKRNVLFVDDEQNVLDGLRRMLRPMRSEWNMTFAPGGEEALKVLEGNHIDVIVSDMRMPGMSGDQLLGEVRRRYPAIVRLVLSGQADRDEILKSTGPIHQFLQKPCNAETLTATISRIIELSNLFEHSKLKTIVSGLETLPSLPSHQEELLSKLQMPEVSPRMVGETISKDLAMSAKILQLVNSAFFGLRRHVTTPADAVVLLGLETVRSLVLTMQVFSQVVEGETNGFSQDALLSHSAVVASIARRIMLSEGRSAEEAEVTYLGGLLHDVGKLVLATELPEEYSKARDLARYEDMTTEEAEKKVIGASHGEIGGYLLGLWAFGPPIVDAAVYHDCPNRHQSTEFSPLAAVHVANAIAHHKQSLDDTTELPVDDEYIDRIGVRDRLPDWYETGRSAA